MCHAHSSLPFFFSSPSRDTPTHPHSYSLFCRPFTGCYNKFYEKGTYTCIVCDQELFSSDTKYDSGCGWPAFNEVLDQGRVKLTKDTSHGKQLWSSFSVSFITHSQNGISLDTHTHTHPLCSFQHRTLHNPFNSTRVHSKLIINKILLISPCTRLLFTKL